MYLIFPAISILFIYFLVLNKKKSNFREKVVVSLLLFFLIILIITESLSIFNFISSTGITVAWSIVSLMLLLLAVRKRKYFVFPNVKLIKNLTFSDKIILIQICIILFVTLILALFVAPNDIDAMSYHLARIPHWIQNQNVFYYATHFSPQIYLAPFASYPALNFQLLAGGDWYANLTQWICMAGSLIVVSLTTKHFGGNLRTQIFASFIAATIPMGIMQSSSSQDDYIVSFFLISYLYFSLRFKSWKKSKIYLLFSGISLGLAFLTKQTAYIFAFPFFFWFLWIWIEKFGIKKTLQIGLIIITLTLSINAPFYYRNYNLTNWPIFSGINYYINEPVGIQSLISGTLKNSSLHLITPFREVNYATYFMIEKTHTLFNIPLQKRGFISMPYDFRINRMRAIEYYAPNLIHFIFIWITLAILLKNRKKQQKLEILYALSVIAGFILFSTFIRWQPSLSRLHLPLFVLYSPIIALIMVSRRSLKLLIVSILTISSIYFLFFNVGKPIIGSKNIFSIPRDQQYFENWIFPKSQYKSYVKAINQVKRTTCNNVGLYYKDEIGYLYEYPIWKMLGNEKKIKIEHIEVDNVTNILANKKFKPDCVIFLSNEPNLINKYLRIQVPIFLIE